MIQKRYQTFTENGKEWSKWFEFSGTLEKWQLKGKLLNEYRELKGDGEVVPLPYSEI